MLAAILALLGISPWVILVVVLAFLILKRYQFKKKPGVFLSRLRIEKGAYPGFGAKWPRSTSLSVWVHDVLLVHTFLPFESVRPLPVKRLVTDAETAHHLDQKGLGDHPVLLELHLDDGTIVQMAVPDEFQTLAQGPFLHSEPTP